MITVRKGLESIYFFLIMSGIKIYLTLFLPFARVCFPIWWCTGLDNKIFQRVIVNIFLPINFNLCFRCSKEPSHWDSSFEYPQHMFLLRNKKISFLLRSLNWSPVIYFGSLHVYCKYFGLRSDCFLRSHLIRAHSVCCHNKTSLGEFG